MDKKEIEKEVDSWLENVYGKGQVPPYEKTDDVLNYLLRLSKLERQESSDLEIVKDLQKHQIEEYKAETKAINAKLKSLGLEKSASLNLEDDLLDNVVDILASAANSLNVDDPSEHNLNLAISDLRLRAAQLPVVAHLQKKQEDRDKAGLLDDIKRLSKSEKALAGAKNDAVVNEPNLGTLRKKIAFMQVRLILSWFHYLVETAPTF